MPQGKAQVTFRIVCNEGSLSAGGGRYLRDREVFIQAADEQEARRKFEEDPQNRVYGRYIKLMERKHE